MYAKFRTIEIYLNETKDHFLLGHIKVIKNRNRFGSSLTAKKIFCALDSSMVTFTS